MDQDLFLQIPLDSKQIIELFTQATNWQERYRQLMLLGKQLPRLPQEQRTPQAQVQGCESDAWLYHCQYNRQHYYLGDSDARIVKGLIVLLLAAFNGKNTDEINAFDHDDYFEHLGLSGQLSPSRTNGLHALIKVIKYYANAQIKS
ncbi:SufE family protein [Shewanella surugensis]|uniref:SufE family protein n=1 Tax=Shewanella surugensis TaxID=212020 RepID=UPI0035D57F62